MVWVFFFSFFFFLIINERLNDPTFFFVLSEMNYVLDFYCIKLNSLWRTAERLSRPCCVFPHRAKSNICFVPRFSPLPGDQRRFQELWVHSLHGREQFEVQLFQLTAAMFIISLSVDNSWTHSWTKKKILVSCAKYPVSVIKGSPWIKKNIFLEKGV